MKTFNTLNELFKETSGRQTTAQELINSCVYLNDGGWTKIELSTELKQEVINKIVDCFGGQERTKTNIRFTLHRETPQHWGLSRTILVKRDNEVRFTYIAGQDYTSELNEIRKKLK